MTDQPPDKKYIKQDPEVVTEVKAEKPKRYYVPNRHDRRRAASIKRHEEKKARKNAKE